jgi:hypothetical protein
MEGETRGAGVVGASLPHAAITATRASVPHEAAEEIEDVM